MDGREDASMDLAASLSFLSSWMEGTAQKVTEKAAQTLDTVQSAIEDLKKEADIWIEQELPELLSAEADVIQLPPSPLIVSESEEDDDLPEGVIARIPDEILFHLFNYLDVFTLAQIGVTSQKFKFLANSNDLWKSLFLRDTGRWQFLQSSSLPPVQASLRGSLASASNRFYNLVTGQETGSDFYNSILSSLSDSNEKPIEEEQPLPKTKTWKDQYRAQHRYNSATQSEWVKAMTPVVSNIDRKLERFDPWTVSSDLIPQSLVNAFQPRVFKILLIGQGLETSGKKLVYEMMWGDNTPFEMSNLFPGKDGMGSGVGFNVEGVTINCSAFYYDSKKEEVKKWKTMFSETQGIFFILDAYGSLEKPTQELKSLLATEMGVPPSIPLVVLPCLPSNDEVFETIHSVQDLAEGLDLNSLDRPWAIQMTDVSGLRGLWQAVIWLLQLSGEIEVEAAHNKQSK